MYNTEIELLYLGLESFEYFVAFEPQRWATVSEKTVISSESFSDSVKDKGKIQKQNSWQDFKINLSSCLWYLIWRSCSLQVPGCLWFTVIYLLYFFFSCFIFFLPFFLCRLPLSACFFWNIFLIIPIGPKVIACFHPLNWLYLIIYRFDFT